MTSNRETTNMKILDLKKLYNFLMSTFSFQIINASKFYLKLFCDVIKKNTHLSF